MIRIFDADLSDAAHAAAVVACIDAYAADPMGGGRPLAPEVRVNMVPGLRATPAASVLLAECDGEIAGAAVCMMGFSTFAARPRLNLHDLSVLPRFRGRGVGRALVEAVAERARAAGCSAVSLEVRLDNEGARQLYRSCGFGEGFAPMEFWLRSL
ncbi:MAG TPA: GNAT family N-acetyltransferase [Solimonas sp.]|nr:GNAT family N-acetyltransferase [Solimonas sp.]